jgi:uncharacterized protein YdcH (DUF465 family)
MSISLKERNERLLENSEELQRRVKELEEFYEISVGREVKMKELKEENEKLKEELSKHNK